MIRTFLSCFFLELWNYICSSEGLLSLFVCLTFSLSFSHSLSDWCDYIGKLRRLFRLPSCMTPSHLMHLHTYTEQPLYGLLVWPICFFYQSHLGVVFQSEDQRFWWRALQGVKVSLSKMLKPVFSLKSSSLLKESIWKNSIKKIFCRTCTKLTGTSFLWSYLTETQLENLEDFYTKTFHHNFNVFQLDCMDATKGNCNLVLYHQSVISY